MPSPPPQSREALDSRCGTPPVDDGVIASISSAKAIDQPPTIAAELAASKPRFIKSSGPNSIVVEACVRDDEEGFCGVGFG